MNSTGTTDPENIIPFAGGGGGDTATATDEPMQDEAKDSIPFRVGEKVLAFHGPCLYDAKAELIDFISNLFLGDKVQMVERHMDEWRCHIHYIGWKKNWDEWLNVGRLLKHNEENVLKQEELIIKYGAEKSAKHGRLWKDKNKSPIGDRGKKKEYQIIEKDECHVPQENIVNIQIPLTLKKQLVDDHERIVHLGQLVNLPCKPNVYEIVGKYLDSRANKDDGLVGEAVKEMVHGLLYYFNKALPAILLYKEERQQHKEVIANNAIPSLVYGAQHLLRLFVKLPEMLSCMKIEMNTSIELQQKLTDFIRFLHNNQSAFFHSSYQKSDGVDPVKNEQN